MKDIPSIIEHYWKSIWIIHQGVLMTLYDFMEMKDSE